MKLQIKDTMLRYFPETKQVRFDFGHIQGVDSPIRYKIWKEDEFVNILKGLTK